MLDRDSIVHLGDGQLSPIRVLIIASDMLLGASLMNILSGETDIVVMGITRNDETNLTKTVQFFKPDIIICTASLIAEEENFMAYVIANHPEIDVLSVSSDDNWVHAYFQKDILLSQASDLAEIIRSH